MPNVIEITDFAAPELDVYARLTQAQLRSRLEPGTPRCIPLTAPCWPS